MKLKIMVENHTFIDQYYLGEPGFSCYLEDGDERILMDTGYSDVLVKNARSMGVDLSALTTLVLSHGHNDHTGGLMPLAESVALSGVRLLAHPDCFSHKEASGEDIGTPFSTEDLVKHCTLTLSQAPVAITQRLFYLGEIPRRFSFEDHSEVGKTYEDGCLVPDVVRDDTALAYQTDQGIFVITGCSHSGICNILEQAKVVCGDSRILGVIGGFHLFSVDERVKRTIEYLKGEDISALYPCHCVSFKVKAAIHQVIPIHEVGVGLTLSIEESGRIKPCRPTA